jgi:threonine synthase
MEAYRLVASEEGVMCEPASAAAIAGLLHRVRAGDDLSEHTAVAVLTGNGLKDPAAALAAVHEPEAVDATLDALLQATIR